MPQETNILNDGYVNFMGGVDSGNAPNELAGNQVAYATNITFRGGYAETRPGFKNITLTFERSEAEEWFKDYGFQGAGVFNDQIIASIGGRIFRIDPNEDWYVTEITPWGVTPVDGAYVSPPIGSSITFTVDDTTHIQSDMPVFVLDGYYTVDSATATTVTVTNVDATPGALIVDNSPLKYLDPNSPIQPHAWMVQAEDWFIVQDGQSAAILYNGDSRRSSPSNKEVPSGSVMAYGQGRLWVAITPRNFVAGDINNGPSDVINFTENDYLGEGGFFSIPKDAGEITAMTFISDLDKSYGQGPLQVMAHRGVFSMNTPVDRDTWKNLTNPIQTQSLIQYGPMGHNNTINVNGDIWYRSRDGIRSFILARRDFTTWGNTPISEEMRRVLREDEQNLLRFGSAVVFDNRILYTTLPRKDGYSCWHAGLAVMDLKPISGLRRGMEPIWEGIWTGLRFTQLLTATISGTERCFSFSVNNSGENELWEITTKDMFDNGSGRIQSSFESRGFTHGNPFEINELEGTEFWWDNIIGEVDFDVDYKPDQYPCWFDWKEWSDCQVSRDCDGSATCGNPTDYKPGYRTRVEVPKPDSVCESNDDKPSTLGYEFGVRLSWTGHARLKRLIVRARRVEEYSSGKLVC